MTNAPANNEPTIHQLTWTPPTPRELPALREHLADYMLHPSTRDCTARMLSRGHGTIVPDRRDPVGSAEVLLADEHRRLARARLYSVTADMTRLALAAAKSMPNWPLKRDETPSEHGFMVFDEPISLYHQPDGDPVNIVACTWGRTMLRNPATGVWLSFWSQTNFARMIATTRALTGHSAAVAEQAVRRDFAELTWDNETFLTWDAPLRTNARLLGQPEQIREEITRQCPLTWARVTRALWCLMQQAALTATDEEPPSRAQQRRARRNGHDPSPVRVIRLHPRARANPSNPASGTGRKLTERIPVTGFWKDQPYGPGRAKRRRIYIADHERGPADAPLRIRPTVTVINRKPADPAP